MVQSEGNQAEEDDEGTRGRNWSFARIEKLLRIDSLDNVPG